jgi:hypothetical protein
MKTTAVTEAMICVFSAICEALPAHSQRRIDSILNAVLSAKMIEDADAVQVLECLIEHRSGPSSADEIVPRSRFCQ